MCLSTHGHRQARLVSFVLKLIAFLMLFTLWTASSVPNIPIPWVLWLQGFFLSQRQPHPTVFWKAQGFPLVITKTVMIMHIKKVQGLKIIQSGLQDYFAPYVNSISLLRNTDRLKTYGFLNTTRYPLLRKFYSDSPNLLADTLYLFP